MAKKEPHPLAGTVVGHCECNDAFCSYKVQVRVNAGGVCYTRCDGSADGGSCTASQNMSKPTSRKFIQAYLDAQKPKESCDKVEDNEQPVPASGDAERPEYGDYRDYLGN